MAPKVDTVEMKLARLGTKSHGVVTRVEIVHAGVTHDEIKNRLGNGLLIREHRGVYRVGHRSPSVKAKYLAAVLACGPDAVLCGRAAAHLLRLTKGAAPPPEVLAPGGHAVPGVITRRSRWLDSRHVTSFRGIPVTTVPRMLVDLAAVLSEDELARACHEAEVLFRVTPAMVEAVLASCPNARGAGVLRRVLHGDVPISLSKIEKVFFEALRAAGMPLPETNRTAGGRRVDCRWPEYRLTVEIDGYRYHHSRHAWERDRRSAREAHARGDEFRRYTYGDVMEDRRYMLAELRRLLARGRLRQP